MTRETPGRTMDGWDWLKALHESIYAKAIFSELTIFVQFDRRMPSMDGGPIDLKAGTSVVWTHPSDDELDHHWEVRNLEKRAAALLALHPVVIDADGYLDAECWIEIHRDRIVCVTSRNDGEETDSTVTLIHSRTREDWKTCIQVTAAVDLPLIEIASLDPGETLTGTGWRIGAHAPGSIGYDEDNQEITIDLPVECYPAIRSAVG